MEEAEAQGKPAEPRAQKSKKEAPKKEMEIDVVEDGAKEVKASEVSPKWIRSAVKVVQPTFKPKINQKSKKLARNSDVVVLLEIDAKRRTLNKMSAVNSRSQQELNTP